MSFLNKINTAINVVRLVQGDRTVSPVAKREINDWARLYPNIEALAFLDYDSVNPAAGFQVRGWSWGAKYFWLDYYRDGQKIVASRWNNATGERLDTKIFTV